MNKRYFDFGDINLIPELGIVNSRNECDTSIRLGNYSFRNPVYPSNMSSVITYTMARELARNGYFYTMHRFLTDEAHLHIIKLMIDDNLIVSISVGIGEKWEAFLKTLSTNNIKPEFITIDIAHGHSLAMEIMIKFIKNLFPETFIIAGNVCTADGAIALHMYGANAVKIGIAPGLVCTTAMQTGFGSRGIQASIINEIHDKHPIIKIIADGGIRQHGDICKALVMGATMVMAGSLFSGLHESGGFVKFVDGVKIIEYHGSASSSQSGKINRIEGTSIDLLHKDKSVLNEMKEINESLQSAISYGGGRDISVLKNVKYIIKN